MRALFWPGMWPCALYVHGRMGALGVADCHGSADLPCREATTCARSSARFGAGLVLAFFAKPFIFQLRSRRQSIIGFYPTISYTLHLAHRAGHTTIH